jgi:hypothetical protein
MKNIKSFLSAGFGLALGLQASLVSVSTSQAAQVDLGLTLGTLTTGSSILSGKAVRLGTFSAYSDASGLSYFTGKDYNTLFSAFTSFTEISSPQVLVTDGVGQIYQSYDTATTAANTRMFAWLYDSASVSSAANWVIVSGGANTSGANDGVFNPVWLAVAPTAGEINVIEIGTVYSQIYASKVVANNILASAVFDSEGANVILIPEPATGTLLSIGVGLLFALRRRKGM